MTWPPTRPVRRTIFGVVFLAVWVVGMFLCWGSINESWTGGGKGLDGITRSMVERTFGFSKWLTWRQITHESTATVVMIEWAIAPRRIVAALIVTAVSSLILYVAWRAAVNALTCAAGTCDACGYDLTGLAQPRCPECGEIIALR